MTLPVLQLKAHRDETVLRGHPWIFSGALRQPIPNLPSGELVDIQDNSGAFVARGYYHPQTDIAVRVLTRDADEEIDTAFLAVRIRRALALREPLVQSGATDAYRLINAEGDFLPGVIVDRYGDVLVAQISTAGMERLTPQLIDALREVVDPAGILLRNDVSVRQREGMEREHPRVAWGEVPPLVTIREHGMRFEVDVWGGQKTGFFLDQRDKRQSLRKYVAGKTVLNAFSYTGSFGVAAALAGATTVTNVEQSGPVVAQARHQMELNGVDPAAHEFAVGDAFAYLERWGEEQRQFDIVILDPPAFAKSVGARTQAVRAYRRLNVLGLNVLRPGGLLVTCSCSGSITLEEFR
ncbi:MAG TPA: class I SAM-dependent rRNA methyltransferase, partial [Ktedonobacterales bacterium]|nr:class I SAM-dependent rRNA methyltransferase [Ktedonobacterales bacterium]